MITFDTPIKEAISFIRQILSDSFNIETHYFPSPYENLDKIDRGFRHLVWKQDNHTTPISNMAELAKGYHLLIIQSTLDFYNLVALIPREGRASDLITVGPFCDHVMSEQDLNHTMQQHHFPADYISLARHFYYSLPAADMQNLTATFRHLLIAFDRNFENVVPEFIDYSEKRHHFLSSDEIMHNFTYDESENYAAHLNAFLSALLNGDSEESLDKLKLLLNFLAYDSITSANQMKKILNFLNVSCCSRMLTTQIHPGFVFECHDHFEWRIENTDERASLLQLPLEISRKYSLLVRNRSLSEYSYLVRNVMNYVTLHISEELNLSSIADYFHKNPSYISGQFSKETGESLTTYIQKERMQTAIRYFNTTNMSVAEVAGSVGIHDFGYFTRLFKKHIGRSPSQYKKMVNPSAGNQP